MPQPKTARRSGVPDAAVPGGIGVDARGNPVPDPTINVARLNEASSQRQDDLREAFFKYVEAGQAHLKELMDLRGQHTREIRALESAHADALRKAEAARVDSIRLVDREDAAKTAAQVLNSVQTLAQQSITKDETLRNQVATVTAQAATQRTMDTAEMNKRLSAVELALSEGKGKQTVADPATERLIAEVAALRQQQAAGTGRSAGANQLWLYLVAGAGLAYTLMNIAEKVAR